MIDEFVQREWTSLCQRLNRTAEYLGEQQQMSETFRRQAKAFAESDVPQRYPELLERVREAAALAVRWQEHGEITIDVDETLEESFPASDPPAWTSAHV